MDAIDQKIDELKHCCNHNPLSTTGHKIPHNLWVASDLKNQQINTILDTEILEHSSEWKNTAPVSVHRPIVTHPFHIELTMG